MLLAYTVAVEAAIAILLTVPSPKLLKKRFVSLISLILQPALFVVPFAGFQILGFPPFSYLTFFYFDFVSFFSFQISIRNLRSDLDFCFGGFFFLWYCVDIYWKNEHRLMCTSEICTAAERDRYEKSVSINA